MDFTTYISDTGRRAALAKAARTSPDYLWQCATGWNGKRASTDLAKRLHDESFRLGPEAIPLASIRPDVWGEAALNPLKAVRRGHGAQRRRTR